MTTTNLITKSTCSNSTNISTQNNNNTHLNNVSSVKLPSGLMQEELHVPMDEKDTYVYYYLTKVSYSNNSSRWLFYIYIYVDICKTRIYKFNIYILIYCSLYN